MYMLLSYGTESICGSYRPEGFATGKALLLELKLNVNIK